MDCPRCRHANPPGQKFCGECGSRLAMAGAPAGESAADGVPESAAIGRGYSASPDIDATSSANSRSAAGYPFNGTWSRR